MLRVTIIVVSYNTRDMTLACLESVFRETKHETFELMVVDNASEDGSADAISDLFPQVRMIKLDDNIGFAAANNLAIEQANGELVLLLNPDTIVLKEAIDKLVVFADQEPLAGIWGGRTLFEDGSLNPASCWARPSLWSVFCQMIGLTMMFRSFRLFNPEAYGGWRRDCDRRVDIVSGCFFLIRRRLWDQLGGFDPAFFMYGGRSGSLSEGD